MPNELLDLYRLADRIGIPANWLKAEAAAGRIPHLKAGRRVLFNLAAVEQVLFDRAAVTVESPTESQEVEAREVVAVSPS